LAIGDLRIRINVSEQQLLMSKQIYGVVEYRPGLLSVLCGAATLGKFLSANGQREVQYVE
jgi:hypothetical protein